MIRHREVTVHRRRVVALGLAAALVGSISVDQVDAAFSARSTTSASLGAIDLNTQVPADLSVDRVDNTTCRTTFTRLTGAAPLSPGVSFQVRDGSNTLVPSTTRLQEDIPVTGASRPTLTYVSQAGGWRSSNSASVVCPYELRGVSWWPLHTDLKDLRSGQDGNATKSAQYTGGPKGGAMLFDGSQEVDTGRRTISPVDHSYSVAAWVRLDDLTSGFQTAVSMEGNKSSFYLQFSDENRRLAFSAAGGRAIAQDMGEPQPGRWYHLVGVYDHAANTNSLYVDGSLTGRVVLTQPNDVPTGNIVLGRARFDDNPVDFLRGALADVHVFDRALTDNEISALAAGEPAP